MIHPAPSDPALTTRASRDGAVVVTPHVLATEAGLDVLRAGGNAVDAAIAANAAQGVVAPQTCGIGGDLFALVHAGGGGAPHALNASGRAGSGTSAAELREQHETMPLRHPATITAPGCIDGWVALSKELGTLPLARTLESSVRLADEGFPASAELAAAADRMRPLLEDQPSARPLYPEHGPLRAGDVVYRPGLAETLRSIAADGRAAFYEGPTATAISTASQGVLTTDDLVEQHAEWVAPLSVDAFGLTGWTMPPNTQGYLALAAAWIFAQLDASRDPTDPGFHHAAIEAYRSIAWERDDIVSDASTAPLAPDELLRPERLTQFVEQIDLTQAGRFPMPTPAPGGTAYLCVRDSSGMNVSLIQSNFWGIGSGLSAGDTGVFLHNRGAGFTLTPGHPNEYEPGRRPLHTLSPTLWTSGRATTMLLGTRGGQFQPQLLVQMIAKLLHAGLAPDDAQRAPRWQVDGWQRGQTPRIRLEGLFPRDIASGLADLGHVVDWAADHEPGWGPMSMIVADGADVIGAADPRISTASAGSTQ